jgi:hypothetical protein
VVALVGGATVQAGAGRFQSACAAGRAHSRRSDRLRLRWGGARERGYDAVQDRMLRDSFSSFLGWERGGSLWALSARRQQGQSVVIGWRSQPFGRGPSLGRGVEGPARLLARLGGQACCRSS